MSAKEMFEKLGYDEELTREWIKYSKEDYFEDYKEIVFDTKHFLINTFSEDRHCLYGKTVILNMKELKAIIKKCSELGWLDNA